MKVFKSKNKYSKGGLYLEYIVAIPLISSYSYAGLVGTELNTDEDITHFRCVFYGKIDVRHSLEFTLSDEEWIKQDEYKDSIYNVIPEAIVDCALSRNEFAKEKVKGRVVTFENKNYENYTAENWNALVLYNYIKYIWSKIQSNNYSYGQIGDFHDSIIKKGRLSQACGEKYAQEIENAYKDIVEYDKGLNLWRLTRGIKDEAQKKLKEKKYEYDDSYDLGEGKYRRIRYSYSTPLQFTGSTARDYQYLSIEIANEKLERILAYNKNGVEEIKLNDYMEIERRKQIYDPKTDKGETTIDLSKKLTDVDPALIIKWYEDDNGIHICNFVHDEQINRTAHTRDNKDFKAKRKLQIIAETPYIKRAGMHKEKVEKKPLILESQCFSGIYDTEKTYTLDIEIRLHGTNDAVILPADCEFLFNMSPTIRKIELLGLKTNAQSLNNMCAYNRNLETITLHIKEAPNLTSIKSIINHNKNLRQATIQINANQITDMRGMFMGCDSCEKINLNIKEKNPPIERDMREMFYAKRLKLIKWGDTVWQNHILNYATDLSKIFCFDDVDRLNYNAILKQITGFKEIFKDKLILDRQIIYALQDLKDLPKLIEANTINTTIYERNLKEAKELLKKAYITGYI